MTARAVRPRLVVLGAALLALVALPAARASEPEPPQPYDDPPFECTVIDYGTEAPPVPGPDDDPLCVRYDKRNITLSTLEAVDFLAAEPARFAIAAGRCAYWQQDEWMVRIDPLSPPLVEWEGSYWYDARTGTGAGILRELRVAGQPADGRAFVEALRPVVGDAAADEIVRYTADGGGGGASFALPEELAFDSCARP